MRIEKTDMEFVTFDAQDVIMTSTTGGGKVYSYLGGSGAIYKAAQQDDQYSSLGTLPGKTYSSGYIDDGYYITGLGTASNTFQYIDAFNMGIFAFASEHLPTNDGNTYEMINVNNMLLADVLAWLQNDAIQEKQ